MTKKLSERAVVSEREGRLTEYEKRWLDRLRKRRERLGGPKPPDPASLVKATPAEYPAVWHRAQ